jgi:UDP-N-acetylmuramate dehydrogenase
MSAAIKRRRDMRSEELLDEPMSAHTSWRVGGNADRFLSPRTVEALAQCLRSVPADEPLYWIGLGSNLLVRDGGLRGTVICTSDLEKSIEQIDDRRVRATASVPCTTLARHCVRLKLGPAAFFAGIPGSLGGALAMNAGAFGGETWENVSSVETIARDGKVTVRGREQFEVGYRSVSSPTDAWFVAATFEFDRDESSDMRDVTEVVKRRGAMQPVGRPSCGSVFRNPPGDHAGRLIEAAGLKGARSGGAVVSDKHANFIINEDDASAADIEALIEHVRATVLADSGVALETEVRIIGERPASEGEQ